MSTPAEERLQEHRREALRSSARAVLTAPFLREADPSSLPPIILPPRTPWRKPR